MSDAVKKPVPLHNYVASGPRKLKLVSFHVLDTIEAVGEEASYKLVAGLFRDSENLSWTAGTFEYPKGLPELTAGSEWEVAHDADGDHFPVVAVLPKGK